MKFSAIQNFARVELTWESVYFSGASTWNVYFRPQIDFTKKPKFAASVHIMMHHHPRSINMHDLIEVQGIGGEIAHFMSSKTVIYSVIKYQFFKYTNFRVVTVV
jgi:hypothetical protein